MDKTIYTKETITETVKAFTEIKNRLLHIYRVVSNHSRNLDGKNDHLVDFTGSDDEVIGFEYIENKDKSNIFITASYNYHDFYMCNEDVIHISSTYYVEYEGNLDHDFNIPAKWLNMSDNEIIEDVKTNYFNLYKDEIGGD